jgi:hypothetical protein
MSQVLTWGNKTAKDSPKYRKQRHLSGRRTLRRRVGGQIPRDEALLDSHTAQIRSGRPLSAKVPEALCKQDKQKGTRILRQLVVLLK